jgi:predicted DNA-binding transcriptional regulator AlpA
MIFGPRPSMSALGQTVTEMDHETEYLPPRQFAQLIGISESTLAKLRMRGNGPAFSKIGRSVRYSRDEGLAWMAAHARRSTAENSQNERFPRKKRHATTA